MMINFTVSIYNILGVSPVKIINCKESLCLINVLMMIISVVEAKTKSLLKFLAKVKVGQFK